VPVIVDLGGWGNRRALVFVGFAAAHQLEWRTRSCSPNEVTWTRALRLPYAMAKNLRTAGLGALRPCVGRVLSRLQQSSVETRTVLSGSSSCIT